MHNSTWLLLVVLQFGVCHATPALTRSPVETSQTLSETLLPVGPKVDNLSAFKVDVISTSSVVVANTGTTASEKVSFGYLWINRPSQYRFEYQEGDFQFVMQCDGTTYTVYLPGDNQYAAHAWPFTLGPPEIFIGSYITAFGPYPGALIANPVMREKIVRDLPQALIQSPSTSQQRVSRMIAKDGKGEFEIMYGSDPLKLPQWTQQITRTPWTRIIQECHLQWNYDKTISNQTKPIPSTVALVGMQEICERVLRHLYSSSYESGQTGYRKYKEEHPD